MVIGPYDKRLRLSRCLNCISRHAKASNPWSYEKSIPVLTVSCSVLWELAVFSVSESFTRLSICN